MLRTLRDTIREVDPAGVDLPRIAGDGSMMIVVHAERAWVALNRWRAVLGWARHVVTALDVVCILGTLAVLGFIALVGVERDGWWWYLASLASLVWFAPALSSRPEMERAESWGVLEFSGLTAAVMGAGGLLALLLGAWWPFVAWAASGAGVALAHMARIRLAAEQLRRLALIDPDSRREMVAERVVEIRYTPAN